ncbi:unnamed protein product [Fraxinus pennsylvanica]|uniref:RNase H type-1 domain-containing protein n=1 Tax=Fraxinus pennsylvanica TaxID=56036 RepID=A0AAD2AE98_9LAMI|nr:unnamed protein product [Fraxinus pennsylvanica]
MWKALSGSLSVDQRIKSVGISLASKCDCCSTGHEENASHVLSSGDFADKVWRKVGALVGVCWRTKQIRVVSWKKPHHNRVKLNVDGSSLGNPGQIGGGRLIKNERSELVSAFSSYFGEGTNNGAELRALIESLKLRSELGVNHIDIECHSSLVVSWVSSLKCSLWYLWDFWDNLLNLL